MRVSLFLLFVCVCQLMATEIDAQNTEIKISRNNMTLRELIEEIEAQTDYLVVFRNQDVNLDQRISFEQKSGKIIDYLDEISEQIGLSFQFDNKYITVVPKNAVTVVNQEKKQVSGKIVDAAGIPIVGANVVEKGTTNGTITDMDGNFTLEVSEKSTLVVSYIGYASQEIVVGNQSRVSIKLQEDSEALDEVVVVGYGTQRKSSMTAAVTNVKVEELQNVPRPSIYSALQGRVAGLVINETTGQPDATASIQIRGLGTIDGGTSPLILIDGSPSGTLAQLSPYDIESISVLKDAAASAIYGARAANGVILVTTKQGNMDDKPTIQFDTYFGLQTLAQFPETLSAYEYATLVDEVHRNDGKANVYSEKDLEMFRTGQTDDLHGNTDWKKLAILRVAPIFTNHLSVSGNSKLGRYYVSGEYVDQKGMVRKIDNYDRINFRANITSDITDKIQIQVLSQEEMDEVIDEYRTYISNQVLAVSIEILDEAISDAVDFDFERFKLSVKIEKVRK